MDVIEPVKQDTAEAAIRGTPGRVGPSRLLLRQAAEAGPLPPAFDALLLPDAFCHDGIDAALDPSGRPGAAGPGRLARRRRRHGGNRSAGAVPATAAGTGARSAARVLRRHP